MTVTPRAPGGMDAYRGQSGRKQAYAGSVPTAPGGNSDWARAYGTEIRALIHRQAARAPRSVQAHLGPSELGAQCHRQVVGKLVAVPPTNHVPSPWPSILGTAAHAWLAQALQDENARTGILRFLSELPVVPILGHSGTTDFYDAAEKAVGDWKGLHIHTPVATPAGWTTMGELQPGDTVFGADGRPCQIIRTYPVQYRDCYRITFDDGSDLITDDVQELPFAIVGKPPKPVTMSTAEAAGMIWSSARKPQRQLRLYNGDALRLPPADLAAHPYVLGCWLGDGGVHGGTIGVCTDDAEEIFGHIRSCGYEISAPYGQRKFVRAVYGLSSQLRVLGLQWRDPAWPDSHGRLAGIKRIPAEYLRGSFEQRLALLQGLMDTDGTWNKTRDQAVFTSVIKELALQVAELVTTLGWKAKIYPHKGRGFGVSVTEYMVVFVPYGASPFRLSRKADLVRAGGTTRSRYRIVKSIEPSLTVPTRCIDVDSPDHLYLAGEQMLPVHNCLGPTSMAKIMAAEGPPRIYRVQLLLYFLGALNLGLEVEKIVLVALPRTAATLDGMYVWEHIPGPEDAVLIAEVLQATALRKQMATEVLARRMTLEQVPITPGSECIWCSQFRPQSARDLGPGCPGTSIGQGSL